MASMQIAAIGATDVGCVRTNNEDQFLCDATHGIFIVCDGMGGHAAGEVASAMACSGLRERIAAIAQDIPPGAPFDARLAIARVQQISEAMNDLSAAIMQAGAHTDRAGMGTTCTAAWFMDGEHVVVAHIGDSRLYLQRDGHIDQVTVDHTLVGELVARGLLAGEDAHNHPQAHILARALGAQSGLPAECFMIAVAPGDTLFLCSDGLHAYLPEAKTLAHTLAEEPAQALSHLMARAKAEGGHDNLTGIVLRAPRGEAVHAAAHLAPFTLVRAHPAFAHLPVALLRRAAALMEKSVMTEGQAVKRRDEGIYWVLSGALLPAAQDAAPTRVEAGQWYGPAPLGAAGQRATTLDCQGITHVLHLTPASLEHLIASCPPLGAHILGAVLQAAIS